VQTNIGLARIADSTLSLVADGITGDFGSGANGSYNGFTAGHLRATNDITLIAGALSGRVLISDQFGVGNWGTNVDILNVTNIYVQNSIFIKGKAAAVVSVNGTNTPILNLKDTATLSWVITMGTNGEATATVSGGGSVYVDGVNVSNPNFKSGSDIIWTIGGTLTNVIPSLAIQTFNTLTYSGTNVTLDASLGNSQAANYKLSLTNATWMTVPTSMPTSPKMFYIWYQQPSTGTVTVGFTNNFHFPGGVVPTVDTNANAQTLLVFMTGPFTNNALNFMGIVPQIQ